MLSVPGFRNSHFCQYLGPETIMTISVSIFLLCKNISLVVVVVSVMVLVMQGRGNLIFQLIISPEATGKDRVIIQTIINVKLS